MPRMLKAELWAPIIATAGLWLAIIFLLAAYASRMWADLAGLLSLIVAPFVYTLSKKIVGDRSQSTVDESAVPDPPESKVGHDWFRFNIYGDTFSSPASSSITSSSLGLWTHAASISKGSASSELGAKNPRIETS